MVAIHALDRELSYDKVRKLVSSMSELGYRHSSTTHTSLQFAANIRHDPERSIKVSPGRPRTSNPVQRLEGTKHMICYVDKDHRCRVCSKPNAQTSSVKGVTRGHIYILNIVSIYGTHVRLE
ncbi:hypothetical protein BsWGS_05590 [Bradybaena similaris]